MDPIYLNLRLSTMKATASFIEQLHTEWEATTKSLDFYQYLMTRIESDIEKTNADIEVWSDK